MDDELQEKMDKPFMITSVARADLVDVGYAEKEALSFTDAEMEQIAIKMSSMYTSDGEFWSELEHAAKRV